MIIQKISVGGLREVYDYVYSMYMTPNNIEYTAPLKAMEKRIKIHLHIEDISIMEYFILSRFVEQTRMLNIMELHAAQMDTTHPMKPSIQRAENIRSQMMEDSSISGEYNDLFYFPGVTRCSASVIFDGDKLNEITGSTSIIVTLFKWIVFNPALKNGGIFGCALSHIPMCVPWVQPLEGEEVSDTDSPRKRYMLPPTETVFDKELKPVPKITFEDFVTYHFVNAYYSFYTQQIREMDLVSNAFYHGCVYNGMRYNDVVLSNIYTPECCINMGGEPNIGKKVENIREYYNDIYFFTAVPDMVVSMSVDVSTDLMTFLHLATLVPARMITAYTSLSVLLRTEDQIPLPESLNGYKVRITNTYQVIRSTKNKLIEDGNHMKAMDYIVYGTPVKFTLTGTVMDFINLINTLSGYTENMDSEEKINRRLYIEGFNAIRRNILTFVDLIHSSFVAPKSTEPF